MKAKNRAHYVQAWQDHIKQLATLYMAAYDFQTAIQAADAYTKMRDELYALVEKAADKQDFETEH